VATHGKDNPMWRGGRTVTQHGYVLIRVGADHHLADVRGYAYEHRLVAEKKLGRRLRKGEIVHHLNENGLDNRPRNIEVAKSRFHHKVSHRRSGVGMRMPGECNKKVPCACGCGKALDKFDAFGRPRKYMRGHNQRRR